MDSSLYMCTDCVKWSFLCLCSQCITFLISIYNYLQQAARPDFLSISLINLSLIIMFQIPEQYTQNLQINATSLFDSYIMSSQTVGSFFWVFVLMAI